MSKYGVFLLRIFPYLDWIRTRKTPYLETFNAVFIISKCKFIKRYNACFRYVFKTMCLKFRKGNYWFKVLEIRVYFLETSFKFRYFWNITRGVDTREIIFWNFWWNIIFPRLWRQLKFNISRIKSNQFDIIHEIPFNEIKVFYWNY